MKWQANIYVSRPLRRESDGWVGRVKAIHGAKWVAIYWAAAVAACLVLDEDRTKDVIELARGVKVAQDVQPADKLALDVDLGKGGPIGVHLESLAHLVVL